MTIEELRVKVVELETQNKTLATENEGYKNTVETLNNTIQQKDDEHTKLKEVNMALFLKVQHQNETPTPSEEPPTNANITVGDILDMIQ